MELCDYSAPNADLDADVSVRPAIAMGPHLARRGFEYGALVGYLFDEGIIVPADTVTEEVRAFLAKKSGQLRPIFDTRCIN